MVLGGLSEPQPDVRIHDDDGNLLFRLDLGHRAEKLAIEYDGRWHEAPEQKVKDDVRRSGLGGVGWQFEIVVNEDLYETPLDTLRRLRCAQAERGIPVPARLSDEWRQHFAPRQIREWPSAS